MKKIYLTFLLVFCFLFSVRAQIHVSAYPFDAFNLSGPPTPGVPSSYNSTGSLVIQKFLYKSGTYWYIIYKGSGVFYYAYRSSINSNNEPPCCDSWEIAAPSTVTTGPWVGSSTYTPLTLTGFTCQNIAPPSIIYVDKLATGANDGSSWANAFIDLQPAIEAASLCNDEIWVAKGTYIPTKDKLYNISPSDARNKTFYINKNLKIYGGFPNGGSSMAGRNTTLYETILSGDIQTPFVENDNTYHVITIEANTTLGSISDQTVIDGLKIMYGNSTIAGTSGAVFNGAGAILTSNGLGINCSPIFNNCIFESNKAETGGGAMYLEASNFSRCVPKIQKSIFVNNVAFAEGDATLYPDIVNTGGGAIKIYGYGNTSISDYGISAANISDSRFLFNATLKNGGGAINVTKGYNGYTSFFATNVEFRSNASGNYGSPCDGGAIYTNNGAYQITNSIFEENYSYRKGGSIYNSNVTSLGALKILNSSFNRNISTSGGNIDNNNAVSEIKNSILWGNGIEIANTASTTNVTYSDVEGGYPGTGNINSNPLFVPLSLKLQNSSPAINASDPTTTSPTTDIIGVNRTGIFDMGAYENPCPSFVGGRIYVNIAATGTNTGETWANAFTDLNSALAASVTCGASDIWVAKGTYRPDNSPTPNRNATFGISGTVNIYGGFNGGETSLSMRPDPQLLTYETILDGNLGVASSVSDNAFTVVSHGGSGIFDGFTIKNGNSCCIPGTNSKDGGGMFITGAPTIQNCQFLNNYAETGGGAVAVWSTAGTDLAPTFIRNLFYHNIARGAGDILFFPSVYRAGGGAIRFYSVGASSSITAVIRGCIFDGNTAPSAGYGGAINSNSAGNQIFVINSVFSGNNSINDGAAIFNENGAVLIINSTFNDNATTVGAYTIYNFNAFGNIVNTILRGSSTEIQNAGSSVVTISNSDIQGYSGVGTSGNIDVDPLFINSANIKGFDNKYFTTDDGLALQNCSPVINAGVDASFLATTDVLGMARKQMGIEDLGAYENNGSGCGYVISIATGDWETGSTWNIGRQPLQTEKAIIDISHIVSINTATAKAKDVELRLNANVKYATAIANLRLGN